MKNTNNKELIDISAELHAVTSKGRVKQKSIKDKLSAITTHEVRYPVSIQSCMPRDIRLADQYASNTIHLSALQEVRAMVSIEMIHLLNKEQRRGTLTYKVLHPTKDQIIPSNVNLKCPKCSGTIDYFTGACNKCDHKENIPPVMQ